MRGRRKYSKVWHHKDNRYLLKDASTSQLLDISLSLNMILEKFRELGYTTIMMEGVDRAIRSVNRQLKKRELP